MVGVPGKSKACHSCKRRRIKVRQPLVDRGMDATAPRHSADNWNSAFSATCKDHNAPSALSPVLSALATSGIEFSLTWEP